jgi:hypothetical protein
VSIPGVLTAIINHHPVDTVPRLGERAYEINFEGRSWELDDGPMGAVCKLLWDVVVTHKIPLTSIASAKKNSEFPYAFDNGSSFTNITASHLIVYVGEPALICREGLSS